MSSLSIQVSTGEAALIRQFAESEGLSISEFARTTMLEKIEDTCDLDALRQAVAEDDGQRFSIDEVLEQV